MLENLQVSPEQLIPDLDSSAIWTIRFLEPEGFEVQLSVESPTGIEALRKGQLVVDKLKEMQCSPVRPPNNKASSSDQVKEEEVICKKHNCTMKLWQKNGKSWYSHKTDDGRWCRGG